MSGFFTELIQPHLGLLFVPAHVLLTAFLALGPNGKHLRGFFADRFRYVLDFVFDFRYFRYHDSIFKIAVIVASVKINAWYPEIGEPSVKRP